MRTYRVKDWNEFQHYKDRSPPWIRLHKRLLDNFKFHSLPVASRALAPMLWLLASENEDLKSGVIKGGDEEIIFRLRMSLEDFQTAIKPLIDKGFIDVASNTLADCKQDAVPETEAEAETEAEVVAVVTREEVPRESNEQQNYLSVAKQVAKAMGIEWDDPRWAGNYSRIELWLKNGWDVDRDIIPTVKRVMANRTNPPSTVKYFEQAIADAHKSRMAPLPEGELKNGNIAKTAGIAPSNTGSQGGNGYGGRKSQTELASDITAEIIRERRAKWESENPGQSYPSGSADDPAEPMLRDAEKVRGGSGYDQDAGRGVSDAFGRLLDRSSDPSIPPIPQDWHRDPEAGGHHCDHRSVDAAAIEGGLQQPVRSEETGGALCANAG